MICAIRWCRYFFQYCRMIVRYVDFNWSTKTVWTLKYISFLWINCIWVLGQLGPCGYGHHCYSKSAAPRLAAADTYLTVPLILFGSFDLTVSCFTLSLLSYFYKCTLSDYPKWTVLIKWLFRMDLNSTLQLSRLPNYINVQYTSTIDHYQHRPDLGPSSVIIDNQLVFDNQ